MVEETLVRTMVMIESFIASLWWVMDGKRWMRGMTGVSRMSRISGIRERRGKRLGRRTEEGFGRDLEIILLDERAYFSNRRCHSNGKS